MNQRDAVLRRLKAKKMAGEKDSRGPIGIFARGKNVYKGGSQAAHSGGGIQFGRPSKNAIRRRQQGRR